MPGGRQKPLLRGRHGAIDKPVVHAERQRADARHPVGDEQHVALVQQAPDRLEVIVHAGRGFVEGHGHALDIRMLIEQPRDVFNLGTVSPRIAEGNDIQAQGPADRGETLAERPGLDRHHLFAGMEQIREGHFHDPGSRTGRQIQVLPGKKEFLEQFDTLGIDRHEIGGAVMAQRPGAGEVHIGVEGDRPRGHEDRVEIHGFTPAFLDVI
jgi:hypothetical protein